MEYCVSSIGEEARRLFLANHLLPIHATMFAAIEIVEFAMFFAVKFRSREIFFLESFWLKAVPVSG